MAKKGKNTPSRKARQQAEVEKKAKQKRYLFIGGGVVLFLLVAFFGWRALSGSSSESAPIVVEGERPLASIPPNQREEYYDAYPEMVIDTGKTYEAVIKTDKGDMRFLLYDDEAPLAVNNFVYLANQGFYDGTIFHRVLADFMAQAGDPSGTGAGGPGYEFADETDNDLGFDQRGLLAMANAGPSTNGSQFFITFAPTPWLDGLHTIFGELIEGDDVLASLTLRDPAAPAGSGDVIEQIVSEEK